jgi:hypothetical protein
VEVVYIYVISLGSKTLLVIEEMAKDGGFGEEFAICVNVTVHLH